MDLKHFFDGQQSRENASSAFLATLLESNTAFRLELLGGVPVDPTLSTDESWDEIRVENIEPWTSPVLRGETGTGSIDITLKSSKTVVLIENKVAPSAKRHGQLLQYYEAALATWGDRRILALYLAPYAELATSEVDLVKRSAAFMARAGRLVPDDAAALDWGQVERLISKLCPPDDWFAHTGMREVRRAIDDATRALPPDTQRDVVRWISKSVRQALAAQVPNAEFSRWPSMAQEAIYTVRGPVSAWLTLRFAVDPATSHLVNVVEDGRVRAIVQAEFSLSRAGWKSPAVTAAWSDLTASGVVRIDGLGDLPLQADRWVRHEEAWDGPAADLEALMIDQGRAMLEFLQPCFDAWVIDKVV